jgi:hypothetical protein
MWFKSKTSVMPHLKNVSDIPDSFKFLTIWNSFLMQSTQQQAISKQRNVAKLGPEEIVILVTTQISP